MQEGHRDPIRYGLRVRVLYRRDHCERWSRGHQWPARDDSWRRHSTPAYHLVRDEGAGAGDQRENTDAALEGKGRDPSVNAGIPGPNNEGLGRMGKEDGASVLCIMSKPGESLKVRNFLTSGKPRNFQYTIPKFQCVK